ncbi:MAG: hypothetical protein H6622_15665 [Halobacteriovoraceae bacterium]|nr:hypothetical protein [Halobacteriovoraceae bacterium]
MNKDNETSEDSLKEESDFIDSRPEGLQIVKRPEDVEKVAQGEQALNKKDETVDGQLGLDEVANKDNCEFTPGESLTFIRVRFPGNAKGQPFLIGDSQYMYGQKVVALSDRGMTVGYVNSFPYQVKFNRGLLPIKRINKIATDDDLKKQKSYYDRERDAEKICLKYIDQYELEMNLTHVEFVQGGKKAVFYFNAPERVDFRELVKGLVQDLKMRIELRQISVRDRAAAIGGIGACGLQTCCSSFLKDYGNVSIKMAKNQNLALIPSKINGVCGQIKCCIKYEDDVYTDKRKKLPKEGNIIKTLNGDIGKVLRLHIIPEQFDLLTTKGVKRRYTVDQWIVSEKLKDKDFPEKLHHITDETSTVIGLKNQLESGEDFQTEYVEDLEGELIDEIEEVNIDESLLKYQDKDDDVTYENNDRTLYHKEKKDSRPGRNNQSKNLSDNRNSKSRNKSKNFKNKKNYRPKGPKPGQ